jgi:hypothetical protein
MLAEIGGSRMTPCIPGRLCVIWDNIAGKEIPDSSLDRISPHGVFMYTYGGVS